MTTATDKRHEAIVDEQIAAAYGALMRAQGTLRSATHSLHRQAGHKMIRTGRGFEQGYYTEPVAEALAVLEAREAEAAAQGRGLGWNDDSTLKHYRTNRDEHARLSAEYTELAKQYTGWSRFFAVPAGHIHSSMDCSTCNNGTSGPTQFGWLPELSGLTEADAVAAHGALLCTVCYPSAPVEWTNHYEVEAARKAAERCPGSGQGPVPQEGASRRYYRYGLCRECGTQQAVTSTSAIRAHKTPKESK